MKRLFPFYVIAILLIALFSMSATQSRTVFAQEPVSPAPTYDPLEEPFVSENPSDYELGRNWYWHFCMPCHGDKGQGLTDEWRAVWEPDHQDCWERGCHNGKNIEDSFAIPTVVPSIVGSGKLVRFTSLEALSDFLKTTHPPQNPGWLTDEHYRAIALYIFNENDRSLVEPTPTPILIPTPTCTQIPETIPDIEPRQGKNVVLYVGLGIILFFVSMWAIRKTREP